MWWVVKTCASCIGRYILYHWVTWETCDDPLPLYKIDIPGSESFFFWEIMDWPPHLYTAFSLDGDDNIVLIVFVDILKFVVGYLVAN